MKHHQTNESVQELLIVTLLESAKLYQISLLTNAEKDFIEITSQNKFISLYFD